MFIPDQVVINSSWCSIVLSIQSNLWYRIWSPKKLTPSPSKNWIIWFQKSSISFSFFQILPKEVNAWTIYSLALLLLSSKVVFCSEIETSWNTVWYKYLGDIWLSNESLGIAFTNDIRSDIKLNVKVLVKVYQIPKLENNSSSKIILNGKSLKWFWDFFGAIQWVQFLIGKFGLLFNKFWKDCRKIVNRAKIIKYFMITMIWRIF